MSLCWGELFAQILFSQFFFSQFKDGKGSYNVLYIVTNTVTMFWSSVQIDVVRDFCRKIPFVCCSWTEPLLQNIQVVLNWEKSQQEKKKSKNPIKRNKHNKKSCWQGMKRRIPLTFYLIVQYKLISAWGSGSWGCVMEIGCKFKQFSWKKRKAGHPGDITQRNGSEQVVPALGLEQPGHHLGSISSGRNKSGAKSGLCNFPSGSLT